MIRKRHYTGSKHTLSPLMTYLDGFRNFRTNFAKLSMERKETCTPYYYLIMGQSNTSGNRQRTGILRINWVLCSLKRIDSGHFKCNYNDSNISPVSPYWRNKVIVLLGQILPLQLVLIIPQNCHFTIGDIERNGPTQKLKWFLK